jgi:hypothetical protein
MEQKSQTKHLVFRKFLISDDINLREKNEMLIGKFPCI